MAKIDIFSTRDWDPPTLVHTIALDIWGPMSTEDIKGNMWILRGVCDETSTIIVDVMKHKYDATST
jgi:hypothetical protein